MEYEIKPESKFSLGIRELWEYRELLYFFIWRDIKVKYKQTVLGVLWVIFQPLILMIVFTFLLGQKFSSELPSSLPYPLFVLSGFLGWNIFSSAINGAGNSMVTNASIIKKIYFPRLLIPVSSVIGAFVDFCVAAVFYAAALVYCQPSLNVSFLIYIPLSLFLVFTAAFGSGTFFSALNVKYRDFRYILPFFVQVLLFVSPVFYPFKFSERLEMFFALNPMYAPLELFRLHLPGYEINYSLILISVASNLIICFTGIFIFRKTERYFADIA